MKKINQKQASCRSSKPKAMAPRQSNSQTDSQEPINKLCGVPGCLHPAFSTTGGLSKHMKKMHPEVQVKHGGHNKKDKPIEKSGRSRGRPRKPVNPTRSMSMEESKDDGYNTAEREYYFANQELVLNSLNNAERISHFDKVMGDKLAPAQDYSSLEEEVHSAQKTLIKEVSLAIDSIEEDPAF